MLYFVAAVAFCVCVRGGVLEYCEGNSYFTLESNQLLYTRIKPVLYIYIYIYITIHLKKSKYSNEPKNSLYFLL